MRISKISRKARKKRKEDREALRGALFRRYLRGTVSSFASEKLLAKLLTVPLNTICCGKKKQRIIGHRYTLTKNTRTFVESKSCVNRYLVNFEYNTCLKVHTYSLYITKDGGNTKLER